MAVFTNVSEADITAWLSNYPLGTLYELQGIPEGIENTNYFVTTSSGRYVLTLFEKLTADELPFFLNLMAHLARHGIPCPAPVANRQNNFLGKLNGKPACIASRLSGQSITRPSAAQCAAMGDMLGRMHTAGQHFQDRMPNPRGAAWRQEAAHAIAGLLPPQEAALLRSELSLHADDALANLPHGVIHADLFRDNVLMEGDRVGGLVDFYFACTDSLLYDVAITVNDWCMTSEYKLDEERAHAMLKAYHAARPFNDAEAKAWPRTLRVAALRFWISRLYDLHLPRSGELVKPRDPEPYRRILQNHIGTAQAVWL